MSSAFIKGMGERLLDARIAFDKFHIVRHINATVDKGEAAPLSRRHLGQGTHAPDQRFETISGLLQTAGRRARVFE